MRTSPFINWGRERADVRPVLLELARARPVGNAVERACARDNALSRVTAEAILQRVVDCGYHCRGELVPAHVCDAADHKTTGDAHAGHGDHARPARLEQALLGNGKLNSGSWNCASTRLQAGARGAARSSLDPFCASRVAASCALGPVSTFTPIAAATTSAPMTEASPTSRGRPATAALCEQCPRMAGDLLVLLRGEHKHLAARCAVTEGIARSAVA